MPVTLSDDEVKEIRTLLHDLERNPFAGNEIRAIGLHEILSHRLLLKLCVQLPELAPRRRA